MKSPRSVSRPQRPNSVLWNLLTLERLMTGSLVHLVYWFGLGVIALGGFGAMGGAIGTALREGFPMGILLGVAFAGAGILVTSALAIVWRSFCEFYVVMIQIGEDLRVLRTAGERGLIQLRVASTDAADEEATPALAASAKRRRTAPDRDQ